MRKIKQMKNDREWVVVEKEPLRSNNPDWKRIAFWANQPIFGRHGGMEKFQMMNVSERAIRLRMMHNEFKTVPDPVYSEHCQCESRLLLWQMFEQECAN